MNLREHARDNVRQERNELREALLKYKEDNSMPTYILSGNIGISINALTHFLNGKKRTTHPSLLKVKEFLKKLEESNKSTCD